MVQYASVKDALTAVRLLHGQQRMFRAASGKRKDGKGAHEAVLWARQVSGDGLYLKKHRVVVRNMPFDATEADVREAFGDFMLWEVTLPRGVDGSARGFAFVGFVCRQDAERAIEKVNGTEIRGRAVAVDWAVSKREFEDEKQRKDTGKAGKEQSEVTEKRQRRLEQGEGGGAALRPGQELESEEEELDPDKEKSRMKNVLDSILGGGGGDDDYFEEIEESDDDDEGDDKDDKDEGGSDDDAADGGSLSDSSSDSGHPSDSDHSAGSAEAHVARKSDPAGNANQTDAVEKLNEQAKRLEASLTKTSTKNPYTVEPGATVFIRNIPIEATQKTVFEAMKRFGFVKSTRLVINKRTQRPKGTAFVDFRSAEDASRAAQASQKAAEKSGPPIFIAGKPVDIHIALGTDDARDLAVRKSKDFAASANTDKGRNLYLAQEGLIAEGSAAWNSLSSSDKEKRARAATESEMKLKSPNFAVSTTRLNVRNVPKSWDEGKLKSLFIKAVKARATRENPKVVQVKILANPSGVSKGIAFVEFKQHDHALCALRELNNNPETWSNDHRPIVEFAIDNVQALKKRTMNQLKQKDSRAGNDADKSDPEATKSKKKKKKRDADETETKSKRKLRMERRQMLKQKNRNANNKPPGKEPSNGPENTENTKNTENTEKAAAPAKAGKSARRREQRRKRELDMAVDGLAKTGVAPVATKAQKKRKSSDNSVEAHVERKLAAAAASLPAGKKKKSTAVLETRWFD
jgi:nucleolar protein 4